MASPFLTANGYYSLGRQRLSGLVLEATGTARFTVPGIISGSDMASPSSLTAGGYYTLGGQRPSSLILGATGAAGLTVPGIISGTGLASLATSISDLTADAQIIAGWALTYRAAEPRARAGSCIVSASGERGFNGAAPTVFHKGSFAQRPPGEARPTFR